MQPIFHLYGIERDDVDYIMETFPIVRRKDEKQYGEYRTKRVILEIYDEMKRAMETGEAYRTRLEPRPADLAVAHEPRGEGRYTFIRRENMTAIWQKMVLVGIYSRQPAFQMKLDFILWLSRLPICYPWPVHLA
jgi:hypothetical protein